MQHKNTININTTNYLMNIKLFKTENYNTTMFTLVLSLGDVTDLGSDFDLYCDSIHF